MNKALYNNIAHINMIQYLLNSEKAQRAFREKTGLNIALISRIGLDRLINKDAGFEKEVFYRFVIWATESYWDAADALQDIEIYTAAKAYLNNSKKGVTN